MSNLRARRPRLSGMLRGRTLAVNRLWSTCREHMICPLPRANDLTAPNGRPGWDSHRGGGRGAGHEGARSHLARVEWTAIVVAGGRCAGGERAHGPAPALAVSARGLRRIVGSSAPRTFAAAGARGGGAADLAAVPGELPGLQCAALLPARHTGAWGAGLLHCRQARPPGRRPCPQTPCPWPAPAPTGAPAPLWGAGTSGW